MESLSLNILPTKNTLEFIQGKNLTSVPTKVVTKLFHRFQTLKDTKKFILVKSPSNVLTAERDTQQPLTLNNMLKLISPITNVKDLTAQAAQNLF